MAIDFSKYIDSASTHYIANSGSDEKGKYRGGTAGDQTGKEWQLKAWYNRPWTVVLRYPNKAVAMKIAELGIAAALNNKIGYDQGQRTTYWTQLKAAGYDPSKIAVACEEDCTAGVTANVKAAGYIFDIYPLQNLSASTTSRNMKSRFVAAGFEALTDKKYLTGYNYLLPGDILLCENHHAATNVTMGRYAKWGPDKNVVEESQVEISGYIAVRHGNYYVRSQANKNAEIITIVHDGDNVPYIGESKGGWNKVYTKNQIGWLSSKAGDVVKTSVEYLIVKDGNWYVRKGAGTGSEKLGVVHGGDKLVFMGLDTEGWVMVEFNGQSGWISKRAIV